MSNPDYDSEEDAILLALATQYRHFGFLLPLEEEEQNTNEASS